MWIVSLALVALTILAAAPMAARAGIEDSWDWADDPATAKPKRKLKVFYNFADTDKLGDKTVRATMDEAIDNWNKVKDQTGWEFVKGGTKDDHDIEIKVDPNLMHAPGGAVGEGIPNETQKNRRVSKTTILFHPGPRATDWDAAGKDKNRTKNPVSTAMHELSHMIRLDHQGGTRSKSKKIKDPQGWGRSILINRDDDVLEVSRDDIAEARASSTAPIKVSQAPAGPGSANVALTVPGFELETPVPVRTPLATLTIPGPAFRNDVDVTFSRVGVIPMPSPFDVPLPFDRVVRAVRIDITGLETDPELDPSSEIVVTIPYEDGAEGEGFLIDLMDPELLPLDERSLQPFFFDPALAGWRPVLSLASGSFRLDSVADVVRIVLLADGALFHPLLDPASPHTVTLLLAIAGVAIPAPGGITLIGLGGLAGLLWALSRRGRAPGDGARPSSTGALPRDGSAPSAPRPWPGTRRPGSGGRS